MTTVGAKPLDPGAAQRSSVVLGITEELPRSFVTGILTKEKRRACSSSLDLGLRKPGSVSSPPSQSPWF